MALRTHLFFPNTLIRPPKSRSCPFQTTTHFRTQVPCTNKNSTADADLASGLATEVAKINTHLLQREEAMNKSRELLFTELCNYLALDKEEVKRKWSKIDEEERRALIKGFVNEWGASFHPLSARSVKEMIEEYLHEEKPSPDSPRSTRFPGLKSIMGFSE
ncbi:protein RMD5 [Salix suchowensis]|nr:protein RMD5 [Salix suchowensis]